MLAGLSEVIKFLLNTISQLRFKCLTEFIPPSTLLVELCLWSILKLALRTLHDGTFSAGREKLKVEPCPGALDTVIRPPCSSTSKREITSPSPVPPPACGERSWARKNLVNSCA